MKFYREKFKSIRKSQRWSSEALSNAANISRQSISKWENGKSIPSPKRILQLAKVLGVKESEISDIPELSTLNGMVCVINRPYFLSITMKKLRL